MKNYTRITIIVFVFLLTSFISHAQRSTFTGTWEYRSGNEIFRIVLWEDTNELDLLKGHYEKVVINSSGDETFIYCSDKEKFQDHNTGWIPFAISLKEIQSKLSGSITDNTVDQSQYDPLKSGQLRMEILSNTGGSNPTITASCKINRDEGIAIKESPNYSVPTDIILTKVND